MSRENQAARFFLEYDGQAIIDRAIERYINSMVANVHETKAERLEFIDQATIRISALNDIMTEIRSLANVNK